MARLRWIYDKLRGIFSRGKRTVDPVAARDEIATAAAARSGELAARLGTGRLTLAGWAQAMAAEVRNATVAQFLLGVGGQSGMTPLLRLHLDGLVSDQMTYLRGFAGEIGSGALTAEQIAARSALYFDSSIGAYEQGRAMSQGLPLPEYPPLHVGCRCQWVYYDDNRERVAQWQTAADERVCPTCTDAATRYARLVVGLAAEAE